LRLRALAGRDELNVCPDDPAGFCDFVDALAVPSDAGCVRAGQVRDLAVCDLDAIAATLQCSYYGNRVESFLACPRCGRGFDLSFDLTALLNSRAERGDPTIGGPDQNGVFSLRDGRRFRLPTGVDQLAVSNLEPTDAARELRSRCVLQGDFEDDPDVLETAMEAAGPLLSRELLAPCPHCRMLQATQFQIQRYFLTALASERRFLNHEIHYLARGYGWSRAEILEMTREDRRLHVQLVLP
jgi:hypothetical protein